MKPIIAIYVIIMTCGLTHSYSIYGGGSSSGNSGNAKRRSNMIAPVLPIYSQVSPQYYDNRAAATNSYIQSQPQYLNVPYMQQQQQQQQSQPQRSIADDYNYRSNPNYYYYPQQRDQYQETLYGIPTYHGEYNPKPYFFAQPSYMSQDDRLETTNPLDYLHEEILQENERERNNAAFMQNLALYNKQLDSLQGRQQQLQQIQDLYNLKSTNEFDDYDVVEQPSDWYDQTSILVDPSAYDGYMQPQQQISQYQPLRSPSDYDDEMVRELKELKQNRRSKAMTYELPKQQQMYQDWQQDRPSQDVLDDADDEDVIDTDNYDDEWINWGGQKRSIQPKKVIADGKQTTEQQQQQQQQTIGKQSKQQLKVNSKVASSLSSTSAPVTTTARQTTTTTTTEKSKILSKLHKIGQKEVVLPRPATPVRRPFSESVMKSLGKGKESDDQVPPPIYKTIKQIIDMEQNLSHLSNNQLPTSKIRKRFVTNEEALAQQLNGLKRTSK